MGTEATSVDGAPERSDVVPDTYAIHVGDGQIDVWQYRVEAPEPAGEWQFVETLDRADDPELTLEYARPMPPSADGYWIYCTSYSCQLDCE